MLRITDYMFHLYSFVSSQLYRSSSFNSSGCGSTGDPGEDMYSDVSLEEDVQGLNYKVSFFFYIIINSLLYISF